ncbi:MAG TPA: hypothetical protein DEB40_13755 [Elusimicrobia bacterium]|nr:hypothetical protein [Elusimicrobiota bacterium]HBT62799.1 hypothetical protein [Elusimicrobiota bacterium]
MENEHLSARFDKLLKRYRSQIDRLDLDLPPVGEIPATTEEPPPQTPETAPLADIVEEPQAPDARRSPETPAAKEPRSSQAPDVLRSPETAALNSEASALPRLEPPPRDPVERITLATPPPRAVVSKPGSRAPRRFPWPYALAAALMLAAAASWWGYRETALPAHQAFALAPAQLRGLVLRDNRLYSTDPQSQILMGFKADGRKLKAEGKLANPVLGQMAWIDGAFWSSSLGREVLYQHGAGPEHGVSRTYTTPNRHPFALCSDGDDLWVGDSQSNLAYRYLIGHSLTGTALTPLNQYTLPGGAPAGLHAADSLLWVLYSQSRHLARYRYDSGTIKPVDETDLSLWLPLVHPVAGMTADSSTLWVLTDSPTTLHRFDLRQLRWK